jgi:hypothetical protein
MLVIGVMSIAESLSIISAVYCRPHRTTHCSGRGNSGALGLAAQLEVGGDPAPAAELLRSVLRLFV